TAQQADLVLPAAGWAEKEGTFVSSERRFGIVKRVARAPGQALADFFIFRAIADAWGCGEMFSRWTDPESVFGILQELSADQPCDFTGVRGYEEVDGGLVQWPYREDDRVDVEHRRDGDAPSPAVGQRRLFADGRFFTPDGRARILFADPAPPPERLSREYPLVLLTGRGTSSQ